MLRTPTEFDKQWNDKRDSWLDFVGGRPVIGYEVEDFFVPEKTILQYKFQVRGTGLEVLYGGRK